MTRSFVASGTDRDAVRIDGVNVWRHAWQRTGQQAEIVEPRYGQRLRFDVWTVATRSRTICFAAGEFSNGVWGFYLEPR